MYLYEVYVRRVVIVLRPSNRKSPAREQSSSSTKRARIICTFEYKSTPLDLYSSRLQVLHKKYSIYFAKQLEATN
uniref:Uncharacterized protein n=1 Tax=Trichogramma kaykai TaxID=54128 RepID=A0ABD2WDV8_9HYME